MKTTVSSSDFHAAFRAYNRVQNFSYEGRSLLFDYLEGIEDDTGEEFELDVISLCCDFNEDNPLDIAKNYAIDLSDYDIEDDDEVKDAVLEYLNENTSVVGETDSGNIVYQTF
jgi:hypothetical protein